MPITFKKTLTAERARAALDYDPESGVFNWKVRTSRCVQVGDVAGGPINTGYHVIRIDTTAYVAHRIAWLIVTGAWPESEVDHINGVKNDNRWCNLRPATAKQNRENQTYAKENSSGVRGVSWVSSRQNWLAQIKTYGHNRNLGRFPALIDAVAARKRAERELFTHHREET